MFARLISSLLAASFFSVGSALAQEAARVERAQQVYTAQKCALCHSIAGKGNKKGALDDVGAKLSGARRWSPSAGPRKRLRRPRPSEAQALS